MLGIRGQRMLRMLAPHYGGFHHLMTPAEVESVLALFDEYRLEFVNSPFERYFLGIIEARLGDEDELLEEKLTFLQRLEQLIRTYLQRNVLAKRVLNLPG